MRRVFPLYSSNLAETFFRACLQYNALDRVQVFQLSVQYDSHAHFSKSSLIYPIFDRIITNKDIYIRDGKSNSGL